MIINHESQQYKDKWKDKSHNNGAYFYSEEICKNIIPYIKTNRPWVTIHCGVAVDNAIVFIHNNLNTERYEYLKDYKNLILVCSQTETMDKVKKYGTPIYLPLSVDVKEIEKYKTNNNKLRLSAYAGRRAKAVNIPPYTIMLSNMSRDRLLRNMERFSYIYAVGRTAIEAKILGAKILPYDPRFPNVDIWKIMDNSEAVEILQKEIDKIDGGNYE